MSKTQTVSRQQAAVTLWSNFERTTGLARLRDVLHDLRKELHNNQSDFLDVRGDAILFRDDAVVVDVPSLLDTEGAVPWEMFLIDLEGVDQALDRWLAEVRARGRNGQSSSGATQSSEEELIAFNRLGDRPAVAVTELDIVGTESDIQFSRSLTDELGCTLARLRWFTTITRNVQGQRLSNGNAGLSSIADYVLLGTLQCDPTHCRLTLELIDLRNFCAIKWTSHFNAPTPFSLTVQEAFANAAAARLDTELLYVEADRQLHRQADHKETAYTLMLQAFPAIHQLERYPFINAGHLLEHATLVDRGSALAHSWVAYWHIFFVGQGWASNPFSSMTRAAQAAKRAMLLDPKDARSVTIYAHVKAFLYRQLDEAAVLHEFALQLNPALVLAWHLSGMTHAYAGRLDDAFDCISQCRILAPDDPHAFYPQGALAIVHLLRRDHVSAAAVGRRVTERQPNFTSAFKAYLAALGHLGHKADAARVLKRLLVLEPHFSLRRFRAGAPYQRKEDLDHFITGLRFSGVT